MRTRFKKTTKRVSASIRELNKMLDTDPKIGGRYFVKSIAMLATDESRSDPKSSEMCVVLRIYDKATCVYQENIAVIYNSSRDIIANFAYHLYWLVNDFVSLTKHEVNNNYKYLTNEQAIKCGVNIIPTRKYTKRKD